MLSFWEVLMKCPICDKKLVKRGSLNTIFDGGAEAVIKSKLLNFSRVYDENQEGYWCPSCAIYKYNVMVLDSKGLLPLPKEFIISKGFLLLMSHRAVKEKSSTLKVN